MRKVLKYMLFLLAAVLLLLIIALALTQTAFFRTKVKEQIEKVVGKNINAQLKIGEIDGNLYNTLVFKSVELVANDTVTARIETLQLNYSPLAYRKRILQVDTIRIFKPDFQAYQDTSGAWSFQEIIPEKQEKKKPKTPKSPLNLKVQVNHFEIHEASLLAHMQHTEVVVGCTDLTLLADASLQKKDIRLNLQHLEANLLTPEIRLKQVSGKYAMNENGIQLDSLLVLTENSDFDLKAEFETIENLGFVLNANKLDKNELALFVPSLKFKQSPIANIDLKTTNNEMQAQIDLWSGREHVLGKLNISPFSELIDKTKAVSYSAELWVENFKIENWLDAEKMDSELNGFIGLKGNNLLDRTRPIAMDANLSSSRYQDIFFKRFEFEGDYSKDSITGYLEVQSEHGQLSFDGKMLNFRNIPQYKAKIVSDSFDLSALIPKMLPTYINGSFDVEGKGFKEKDLELTAKVELGKSRIYHIPLDTMNTVVTFTQKTLDFGTVDLQIPGASANASGSLAFDSMFLFVDARVEAESLHFLDSIVMVDVAYDKTLAEAQLFGNVKDLSLKGKASVDAPYAYGYSAAKTDATVNCSFKKDSLVVDVHAGLNQAISSPIVWDTLTTRFYMQENKMWIDADANWTDTMSLHTKTSIELADTIQININELTASTIVSSYYLDDTLQINYEDLHHFDILNLQLKDRNNPEFLIKGDGTISMLDESNLNLQVNEFQIRPLNRLIPSIDTLSGIVSSTFSFHGRAASPVIDGKLKISKPRLGTQGFETLNASFSYKDQFGEAEISTNDKGKSFLAEIQSNFNLSMDSLHFSFSSPEKFNAKLKADSLSINTAFQDLIQIDSLSGLVKADIEATGTFDSPLFYGTIRLEDGHYTDESLGLRYNNIRTKMHFEGKKIVLDTLTVQQKNGFVSATGSVEFDSTIIKGNIISSSLQADAESFFLTQHRNYEILLDANTFIRSKNKSPEFGGKIYVKRSDIFLPAILKQEEEDHIYDTPLLVDALKEAGDSNYFYRTPLRHDRKTNSRLPNILENLTGKLNLEIPRNTWIKSDDMRLELSGDVDIVKTGPYFELFGNIDVVRGHYILYGKKLNLQESQLIFQGGEKLNPTLNFNAEYVYRDGNKDKRYLELIVTGELEDPEITFLLDESEISETDGVSVLIFGATSDELGYGTQNGIIGSIGSNAVASVITSQLSKTIGSQFNLDMIEVTATENWQSAAFVVGKYITNDIFVIYERGFGETDGDEITPETITVEYELNNKLFLRLQSGSSRTSGVDLLLKLEKEIK